MKTYHFALLISSPTVDEETAADRLYSGGCDDALFCVSGGVYEVEVDRRASSLEAAVTSAIEDLNRSSIGARVLRVVPDDLVNAKAIAERSGRTRQGVSLWIRGGVGERFPPPCAKVGQSPVWSWSAVAAWLHERGELEAEALDEARFLAHVNRTLQVDEDSSRHPSHPREVPPRRPSR